MADAKKKFQPCETGNGMDMEERNVDKDLTYASCQAAKRKSYVGSLQRDLHDQRKIPIPTRMHMRAIVG
jgi:hypothetical protein